jgi:hypothetical protein
MSFIEDEEAFGVFNQQADDNEAMPLEDLPQDVDGDQFGEQMNQEQTSGTDYGSHMINKTKSFLRRPKRSKPTTNLKNSR